MKFNAFILCVEHSRTPVPSTGTSIIVNVISWWFCHALVPLPLFWFSWYLIIFTGIFLMDMVRCHIWHYSISLVPLHVISNYAHNLYLNSEMKWFIISSAFWHKLIHLIRLQMDGLTRTKELVFVLAATNLPWELDAAMLRRLEKRVSFDVFC
jgi:SpoVK/Ycf46/Vps4 family AAA+-type ATPase